LMSRTLSEIEKVFERSGSRYEIVDYPKRGKKSVDVLVVKGDERFVIRVIDNVSRMQKVEADELKRLAASFSCKPVVISSDNTDEDLPIDKGVPLVHPKTLERRLAGEKFFTIYALLHSNATFFLLPGSGTYIPVRCIPLRGYLTGINAEVCGLIEDSQGVVVSYEGGYLVAWGVFPKLPSSNLVMLGAVGVLPSYRVGELTNAYVVFTAVAAIAPLLIALGAYVSDCSE